MKFPTPHQLLFLLSYERRTGDEGGLEMVTKTLTEMRRGGIHDHLGFGFHRYSTDPSWHLPHFEKLLYDQALLMLVYVEAFARTGDPMFSSTAREIAGYVQREMTSPAGAFYSAEGADSEGEEGRFYLWTENEIRAVVDAFGISLAGISPFTAQLAARDGLATAYVCVDNACSFPTTNPAMMVEQVRKRLKERGG